MGRRAVSRAIRKSLRRVIRKSLTASPATAATTLVAASYRVAGLAQLVLRQVDSQLIAFIDLHLVVYSACADQWKESHAI
jgi:hypothetical protein